MTDKTFPKPFLSDDSDGGLRITNVIMEDDKLTFDINSIPTGLESLSDNRKIQLLFNEGILYVTADTNVDHIIVVDISGKILEDLESVYGTQKTLDFSTIYREIRGVYSQ